MPRFSESPILAAEAYETAAREHRAADEIALAEWAETRSNELRLLAQRMSAHV